MKVLIECYKDIFKELREIQYEANSAALTMGEIGLKGTCITITKRIHDLFLHMNVKPIIKNELTQNDKRFRALMSHCKSDFIWNHVFIDEQKELGNNVEAVLDALYKQGDGHYGSLK